MVCLTRALPRCRYFAALWFAATATRAAATDLSGIILYEVAPPAMSIAGAWHTSLDPAAAPLGLARFLPPASLAARFLNDESGAISVGLDTGPAWPYAPAKQLFTAFWQRTATGIPLGFVVNFFFNGDTLYPGISVMVPTWSGSGFTRFQRNDAPTTLALHLREVENSGDMEYRDGELRVALSALYIGFTGGSGQADRVGPHDFAPDGLGDMIAIIELTIAADGSQTARPAAPSVGRQVLPLLAPPLVIGAGPAPISGRTPPSNYPGAKSGGPQAQHTVPTAATEAPDADAAGHVSATLPATAGSPPPGTPQTPATAGTRVRTNTRGTPPAATPTPARSGTPSPGTPLPSAASSSPSPPAQPLP